MNDLIDRQKTLEKIYQLQPFPIIDRDAYEFYRDVRESIKSMPSAQSEIVRCKDCRHANECHKSVQYTRDEPNTITIGYLPIEWCSRGERRTDG